jgi:hypothetical protein
VAPFRSALVGLVFFFLLYGLGSPAQELGGSTPPNTTIAFIGDQSLSSDAVAVLEMIRDEGADAVVHQGDFDYQEDPPAWDAFVNSVLGENFPYFASVGNHDDAVFYGAGGYQEFLEARMNRIGIPWSGDLGVQSAHHFQGIFILLTAPDVFGDGDSDHAPYIRDELAADDSIWSIASWHKNMSDMQVGGKSDDTGWGVYEESRRGGAIVATGHEHSYSRTHLMADMEGLVVASTAEPLVLADDDPSTGDDEGRTFAFVSGLGGKSPRNQERDGDWWASIYTSDQGATSGALFGVFNFEGNPNQALFYFKDIDGNIIDEFMVVSDVGKEGPATPVEPPTEPTKAACDDGIDNDGDTRVDFPTDLGCSDFTDETEDSEPEEPTVPEEPTKPEEPTVPEEPTKPEEPTVPEEPTKPEEPTAPEEPTEPEEPTVPEEPTEPEEPTVPEEPTKPEEPTVPEPATPKSRRRRTPVRSPE